MVPSFLFAAVMVLQLSRAAAYSRRLFQEAALRRQRLFEAVVATDDKSYWNKRSSTSGDKDGGAVVYMPAYAIPDGSPVDPCVTCQSYMTTPWCQRNTASCRRSTSQNGSTTSTTKSNCLEPVVQYEKPN